MADFNFSNAIDFTKIGHHEFHVERVDKPRFVVKVVENVQHYVELMRQ